MNDNLFTILKKIKITAYSLFNYFIPIGLFVSIGLLLFPSAGRDDAHITYWPAYTLTHFGEILNYNGERVEQSSSLLQVIFVAILGKISNVNIVTIGRLSSIIFGIATLLMLQYVVTREVGKIVGLCAALLISISIYFVYWSFGGLETTLAAFTIVCLITTYAHYMTTSYFPSYLKLVLPTVSTIFLFTVRPEMPIVVVCSILGALIIVFCKRLFFKNDIYCNSWQIRLFILIIMCVTIFAIIVLFRIWYFDSLFPQPVYSKSRGISIAVFMRGIAYFQRLFLYSWSMAIITTITTIIMIVFSISELKNSRNHPYILFSLLFIISYSTFIMLGGGDWMEGGRFFVPILPIALSLIPIGIQKFSKNLRWIIISTCILLVLEIHVIIVFAQRESISFFWWHTADHLRNKAYDTSQYSWFEQKNRVNAGDIPCLYYLNKTIEHLLSYQKTPIIIMTYQMGFVPYHLSLKYFGNIRFIDTAGLADRGFTDCSLTPKSHTSFVIDVSWEWYFDHQQQLQQYCHIPKPHILYSLTAFDDMFLKKNGYIIIYGQHIKVKDADSKEKIQFELTKHSMNILRNAGMNEVTSRALKSLKGRLFEDEDTLLEAVRSVIGEKETLKYRQVITQAAITTYIQQGFMERLIIREGYIAVRYDLLPVFKSIQPIFIE